MTILSRKNLFFSKSMETAQARLKQLQKEANHNIRKYYKDKKVVISKTQLDHINKLSK